MITTNITMWNSRLFLVLFVLVPLFACTSERNGLPDPLVFPDGTRVQSADEWISARRPSIVALYEQEVYGKTPGNPDSVVHELVSSRKILDGKAIMNQVTLRVYKTGRFVDLHLLEFLPAQVSLEPVGCFVGLNFWGNQTVFPDSSIRLTDKWMLDYEIEGIVDHFATEQSRWIQVDRWPIELITSMGYAVVTCHSADIDEDRVNFDDGVQSLFYSDSQTKPDSAGWGTIAAWAWGMSRVTDYLVTHEAIDAAKIMAIGHSRYGKAALWAAALDQRFAAVISNNSGCGGAAIFRDKEGERVADINRSFPHWFCDNFKRYDNKEDSLPLDQHMLLSLIAPRPLYVASATNDQWADPGNEFLATRLVQPVYTLLMGKEGNLLVDPLPGIPQIGTISYHLREGEHDIVAWDWEQYLRFADEVVGK